ncbi:hypothetical protein AAVH_11625 [Aphelenchoides avenae]|nr:hypothetical protein AAVH_11625 [Aphelenchus avenae]
MGDEHVVGSNGHGGLRPYLARGSTLKPGDLVSFYPVYPRCYDLAAGCVLVERDYLEVQSADDNEFYVSILLCNNSGDDTFYELPHLGRVSDPMKLIRSGWSGYASKFTMKADIDTRGGRVTLTITNLVAVHKFAALRLREHVRRVQQPDNFTITEVDGSRDIPRLIDFDEPPDELDNKDDFLQDSLANLIVSSPKCGASRCGLQSPVKSHDSGIASPDDLSLASEMMPASEHTNFVVPLANGAASAHAEPDVPCPAAAKKTTVSEYPFVGIVCSRLESLCFVSSPRLDKEAGLVDEDGVIQIGQWLTFDIGNGPPDDVHHVSKFSAIDALCATVRIQEYIVVQCEVVIRQTADGPPVVSCRMCSPVRDPERLVRSLPSGSYQADLRYVYEEGQLSGYWCVDRVL